MTMIYPKVKVAAVQFAPKMLDLDGSVAHACDMIREAGANGANVIAFPEAAIPGYPWWIWMTDPGSGMKYYSRLFQNAVEIPSPSVQRLSQAARDAGAYVCISVTEREQGSLYLTQLWFDPTGALVGKHRKLKATNAR